MAAFSTANAQVVVSFDDQEIGDGDVLTFYTSNDSEWEVFECGDHMKPFIKLAEGATNKKITVTVEVSEAAAAGQFFTWCGITNMCTNIKQTKETRSAEVNALLGTSLQLHPLMVTEGQYFDETVKVTVQCGMQSMTFTERFVYSEETMNKGMEYTGIDNPMTGKGNVVFNGNALTYNFTHNAARKVQLFGIDGKLVKNVAVSGTDGSLNLNGMPKGVYVFSVKEGNKQLQSGKIVLK